MKVKDVYRSGGSTTRRLSLLRSLWRDVKLSVLMTRDLMTGRYRHFPLRASVALVLALAYIISPVDLITDLAPIVGWLDDGAVALLCMKLAEHDLLRYDRWRTASRESSDG